MHEATIDAVAATVSATVQEAGSGIRGATCNGRAAVVRGTVVACTVPLVGGFNDVTVQVMDLAGNSGSTGVQIWHDAPVSTVVIVPGKATLLVGASRSMQPVDDVGRPLAPVRWFVSNPAVVAIKEFETGACIVDALEPGDATVTAIWGQMKAEATVTVRAGSIPVGTTKWSVAPRDGYKTQDIIYAADGERMFQVVHGDRRRPDARRLRSGIGPRALRPPRATRHDQGPRGDAAGRTPHVHDGTAARRTLPARPGRSCRSGALTLTVSSACRCTYSSTGCCPCRTSSSP